MLQRILNARQFGLKLIANVTYGYTAAGFSGRMPCAELADSIVQVSTTAQILSSTMCLFATLHFIGEFTSKELPEAIKRCLKHLRAVLL